MSRTAGLDKRGLKCALLWLALALCGASFGSAQTAHADAAGERKRTLLAHVRRIVVVPPFFGTDTLEKAFGPEQEEKPADASNRAKPPSRKPAEPDPRLKEYAEQLRKLEEHARTLLPKRVAARTPFEVVLAAELAKAFKELNLTPASLFQNRGRIRDSRFALPDAEAVRKLASYLHADAVLLGTMDEPRRTNRRYFFDPYNIINYESAHVRSKAGFFVMLADGTEVLHDYVEALQPLSRIGSREYLLADWLDATALVIEDMLDELTRYTPPKS
ncbi:MAG TPA: hypothetical protein VFB38_17885 [Chthonomonadaceae bacterium]|nr:hypothetical protein [Chthonomonadaceae bacterium]